MVMVHQSMVVRAQSEQAGVHMCKWYTCQWWQEMHLRKLLYASVELTTCSASGKFSVRCLSGNLIQAHSCKTRLQEHCVRMIAMHQLPGNAATNIHQLFRQQMHKYRFSPAAAASPALLLVCFRASSQLSTLRYQTGSASGCPCHGLYA